MTRAMLDLPLALRPVTISDVGASRLSCASILQLTFVAMAMPVGVTMSISARAGNRHFWRLSALRTHTDLP